MEPNTSLVYERTTIIMETGLKKRLQIAAIEEGMTMTALLGVVVTQYLNSRALNSKE